RPACPPTATKHCNAVSSEDPSIGLTDLFYPLPPPACMDRGDSGRVFGEWLTHPVGIFGLWGRAGVPWSEKSIMSQRHEFVMLFEQEEVNRRELCRRFAISPTIGYRLLRRYRQAGRAGLADRSRRPQRSPARTSVAMESSVLALRDEHPAWGGRKIRRRLQDLGYQAAPSASTITAILQRNGRIDAAISRQHRAFERFERAAPNELWQM